MATPNFGYVEPTVGGDDGVWGDKLNTFITQLDTDLDKKGGNKVNILFYSENTIYDGVTSASTPIANALADVPLFGTLYIPNKGAGTYLLTSDFDLTSYPDITIEIEDGAKIDFDSTYDFIANNTQIIGNSQIFENINNFTGTIRNLLLPKWFGAGISEGVDDDLSILTKVISIADTIDKPINFESLTYRITNTLTISGGIELYAFYSTILCEGDFVGVHFTGNSSFNYFYGVLEVNRYGSEATDGESPSTSATAHGVVFDSRMVIKGLLSSRYHQGNGFQFNSDGNRNRSQFDYLYAGNNAQYGMQFSGISDNSAVWKINTQTKDNYLGGLYFDDDYAGRAWDANFYNEDSTNNGTGHGIYVGKLSSSRIWTYSEEQSTTGKEIYINTNCGNLEIFEGRSGTVTNNGTNVKLYNGLKNTMYGTTGVVGYKKLENVTDDSTKYGDDDVYTSVGKIFTRRYYGNGEIGDIVRDGNLDGQESEHRETHTGRDLYKYHSTPKTRDRFFANRGTKASPAACQNNDVIYELLSYLNTTGSDYTNAFKMYVTATSIGGGNKAIANMIMGLANDSSSVTDLWKFYPNGDIECLINGTGLIVQSPNTTRWRITVDDSGNMVTTSL